MLTHKTENNVFGFIVARKEADFRTHNRHRYYDNLSLLV
nr:MAG TPA: hypothetical protein [Caudoviricetes sp.]